MLKSAFKGRGLPYLLLSVFGGSPSSFDTTYKSDDSKYQHHHTTTHYYTYPHGTEWVTGGLWFIAVWQGSYDRIPIRGLVPLFAHIPTNKYCVKCIIFHCKWTDVVVVVVVVDVIVGVRSVRHLTNNEHHSPLTIHHHPPNHNQSISTVHHIFLCVRMWWLWWSVVARNFLHHNIVIPDVR